MAGVSEFPVCSAYSISAFCVLPIDYLPFTKWIVIILLAVIASGWRPRYTGIIHWWIASSLQNTATSLDGGEQVTTVLTLLLIPITLLDGRKWHWETASLKTSKWSKHASVIAFVSLIAVKVQMSVIYFNAGIARLKNPEWIDGSAVYYYFNSAMLGFNDTMLAIFGPLLTSPFVFVITWGTTVVELILAASLFAPIKHYKLYFWLGFLLHTAIAVLLGLWSFSAIMIAGLILSLRDYDDVFQFKWLSRLRIKKNICNTQVNYGSPKFQAAESGNLTMHSSARGE
jgi:antimicrobial peptide system SdpB family protein